MTNQEVLDIIMVNVHSPGLSKILVEEAMKKKKYYLDNISLIVVNL